MANETPAEKKRLEIEAELKERLGCAQQEYQRFAPDFRECYAFMLPHRVLPNDTSIERRESADTFTTLGEEVCTDFASDMADTFTPEHLQWAGIEVASSVDETIKEEVKEAAAKESEIIFDAVRASGFHEACKMGNKDLAISAFALAIEDDGAGEPFRCQVIPLTELRILRDSRGKIGTRLWVRNMTPAEIKREFGDLNLPDEVTTALKERKQGRFEVVQGCYGDYSKKAEVAWINCTMIAGKLISWIRKVGVGSAKIIPCRWDPDPMFAWGTGPGIKALGDFRELDETAYLKMKGLARQVDPPIQYPDDSVINLDGGLPNGVAIPTASDSVIRTIESEHPIDIAMFAVRDCEDRIRRHFYLDEPRQEGKTPPTLGQWMDESIRRQRRLGTPAAPVWPEFLYECFMRFRYLLVQRGTLKQGLPVGKDVLPIRPVNPLKRAAQQEEAAASMRYLGGVGELFGPEVLAASVDIGKTMHRLKDQSHATGVALRTEEEINGAINQMQQAQLAEHAAAAAAPVMATASKK